MRMDIREEIRQSMSELEETAAGTLRARFTFGPDFIGFQGHFPEMPILPGICKIQAVLVMLEAHHKRKVRLRKVVLAKFIKPVSYEQELVFECRCSAISDANIRAKTTVTRAAEKVATLDLEVTLDDRGDSQ